jgi:hypothetical protein
MVGQLGSPAAAARAHQEMFAYWASLRRPGRLPGRQHVDPAGMKRLLPTVSLIDILGAGGAACDRDYRYRLAGTGLYTVYGREITGAGLCDIYNSTAADYWRSELEKVVDGGRPGVGCHNFAWRGAAHLSILWLRLPLASNGRDVDMILGYDAVIGLQSENSGSGIRAA